MSKHSYVLEDVLMNGLNILLTNQNEKKKKKFEKVRYDKCV